MADVEIGLARAEEVGAVPVIEARAATLFRPDVLPPALAAQTTSADTYHRAQQEGRLLVARSDAAVVGFAHLRVVDGRAHLEEVDVDPDHGRRGIGRALVEAAIEWARNVADGSITLSTFRDVAWNAPFYARLGFEVVPIKACTSGLLGLRESERASGLDVDRRVIMRRPSGEAPSGQAIRV